MEYHVFLGTGLLSRKTGNETSTERKEAGYGTEFQIIIRQIFEISLAGLLIKGWGTQ
jgi:hypothetical protein